MPDDLTTGEAEAWRRGAEEMREAAAAETDCGCHSRLAVLDAYKDAGWRGAARVCAHGDACLAVSAAAIRALPIPPPPRDLLADGLCDRGA